MQDACDKPSEDPALERALTDLLRQVEGEPIPDHLRDLARRLEQALARAARERDEPGQD